MTRDAAPLFHPFETGALDIPAAGSRAIFLGARADLRRPTGFDAELHCVQGFRPEFLKLQRAGLSVSPEPAGENYDIALIVASRHRGENELRLAEAIVRIRPGGLVVMAGGKTDGTSSLRKRLAQDIGVEGHLSKNHGEAFWLQRGVEADAWALQQSTPTLNPSPQGGGELGTDMTRSPSPLWGRVRGGGVLVDGRFHAAPGMFSHDRIDAASKLLADILPTKLSGRAADFCAGWGYLSAELAAKAPGVTAIELFEADFAALEAAKVNMAALAPQIEAAFHWADLATEKVERRFDVIVMNPPFHQGRAAEPGIGQAMVRAASDALKPNGQLFMVANRGLPYDEALAKGFRQVEVLTEDKTFQVWRARR